MTSHKTLLSLGGESKDTEMKAALEPQPAKWVFPSGKAVSQIRDKTLSKALQSLGLKKTDDINTPIKVSDEKKKIYSAIEIKNYGELLFPAITHFATDYVITLSELKRLSILERNGEAVFSSKSQANKQLATSYDLISRMIKAGGEFGQLVIPNSNEGYHYPILGIPLTLFTDTFTSVFYYDPLYVLSVFVYKLEYDADYISAGRLLEALSSLILTTPQNRYQPLQTHWQLDAVVDSTDALFTQLSKTKDLCPAVWEYPGRTLKLSQQVSIRLENGNYICKEGTILNGAFIIACLKSYLVNNVEPALLKCKNLLNTAYKVTDLDETCKESGDSLFVIFARTVKKDNRILTSPFGKAFISFFIRDLLSLIYKFFINSQNLLTTSNIIKFIQNYTDKMIDKPNEKKDWTAEKRKEIKKIYRDARNIFFVYIAQPVVACVLECSTTERLNQLPHPFREILLLHNFDLNKSLTENQYEGTQLCQPFLNAILNLNVFKSESNSESIYILYLLFNKKIREHELQTHTIITYAVNNRHFGTIEFLLMLPYVGFSLSRDAIEPATRNNMPQDNIRLEGITAVLRSEHLLNHFPENTKFEIENTLLQDLYRHFNSACQNDNKSMATLFQRKINELAAAHFVAFSEQHKTLTLCPSDDPAWKKKCESFLEATITQHQKNNLYWYFKNHFFNGLQQVLIHEQPFIAAYMALYKSKIPEPLKRSIFEFAWPVQNESQKKLRDMILKKIFFVRAQREDKSSKTALPAPQTEQESDATPPPQKKYRASSSSSSQFFSGSAGGSVTKAEAKTSKDSASHKQVAGRGNKLN